MILVADESVDRPVIERLRLDGHIIHSVAEFAPSIPDEEVLELAQRAAAPLLTADKDFGELVFPRHQLSNGVLLLRLAGLTPATKAQVVATILQQHGAEVAGALWSSPRSPFGFGETSPDALRKLIRYTFSEDLFIPPVDEYRQTGLDY